MIHIRHNSRIARWVNDNVMPIDAITIDPCIYITGHNIGTTLLRHETIHIHQQRECGRAWFFVLYVWYYLKNRAKLMGHFDAYMAIPFEVEAYGNQSDPSYLKKRQRHAWKSYRKIVVP